MDKTSRFQLSAFFDNFANLIIEAAGGNRGYPESPGSGGNRIYPESPMTSLVHDIHSGFNKNENGKHSSTKDEYSSDMINDSNDLDEDQAPDGESEIFDFENADSLSLGSGASGVGVGSGIFKQHYDLNTINNVAQNLQFGSKQMVDVHLPVCYSSQDDSETEARKENSIVQVFCKIIYKISNTFSKDFVKL